MDPSFVATAQAKIEQYELLTHADGQAVASADDLKRVLGVARGAGKVTIKAVTVHMGESRVVDLAIGRGGAR